MRTVLNITYMSRLLIKVSFLPSEEDALKYEYLCPRIDAPVISLGQKR